MNVQRGLLLLCIFFNHQFVVSLQKQDAAVIIASSMPIQKVIEVKNGVARHPHYRMSNPVDLAFYNNECIAVVGNNGSGKSMLIDLITEKHPLLMNQVIFDFSPSKLKSNYENIKHVTFYDSYGTDDGTYYYQQRWNQHDVDDYPTVGELLDNSIQMIKSRLDSELTLTESEKKQINDEREVMRNRLYSLFHLNQLLDKRIVFLSSGELRKFQITRALLCNPRVLILDNPFIGLDKYARQQLHDLLEKLVNETDLLLILVLSKTDDTPDFVTHVVEVDKMNVCNKQTLAEWRKKQPEEPEKELCDEIADRILALPYTNEKSNVSDDPSLEIIKFDDVSIRYGDRIILNHLSFNVHNGEHWALSGENGSGKSTLLSIVCADNPQAYANNITLFGHKRGSGESIWDIKKHIGYISPEMHRAYLKDMRSIEIVASGLRDSIGLYYKPKPEQLSICRFWMEVFHIADKENVTFLKLSSGEQRLVLLARTFVKDPCLLILDEPLHGLDLKNRRLVKDIIKAFCKRKNKTLIMVTHYEHELPDIIDHHIYLKKN